MIIKVRERSITRPNHVKRELTFEAPIPNNLAVLVEKYGAIECVEMIRAYLAKRYQDVARRLMIQGKSDAEIIRYMRNYQP